MYFKAAKNICWNVNGNQKLFKKRTGSFTFMYGTAVRNMKMSIPFKR